MVGFGEAEAADPLAAGQLGQVFLLLASVPNSWIGTITSELCTLIIER